MKKQLKVIELFAGIGAPRKALIRGGYNFKIVDAIEIDKYAVKSYNAIYNANIEPKDVCEYKPDKIDIGEIDLLFHGSPCQDFSLAGKQAGGDKDSGTRSSLMYETIRIVEELKPKYVIWENVKNLLSKKHKHNFDAYLEKMKQLGYTNYYQVLNAKDYGIPQNRERVFTVSILGDEKYDFPKGDECNNKIDVVGNYMPSGHDASRIVNENGLAPTVKENHGTVTAVAINFAFPPKQELKLKLRDMLEDDVDEKYYLSDKTLQNYTRNFGSKGKMQNEESFCETLQAAMGTGGGNVPIVSRKYGVFDTKKSRHQAGSVYDENGLSPTLDTMQGGYRQPCVEIKEATKLGYKEAYEGDGVYTNTSTKRGTAQKDMIQTLTTFQDKGVVVKEYKTFIDKHYDNFKNKNGYIPKMFNPYNESEIKEVAPTQSTQCGSSTSSATVLKYDGLRIRKLTPKECWRLMGFDDEDFEKASKVNSNTQLYKQAGNSIVVNVLEAIFDNLLQEYK